MENFFFYTLDIIGNDLYVFLFCLISRLARFFSSTSPSIFFLCRVHKELTNITFNSFHCNSILAIVTTSTSFFSYSCWCDVMTCIYIYIYILSKKQKAQHLLFCWSHENCMLVWSNIVVNYSKRVLLNNVLIRMLFIFGSFSMI